MAQQGLTGIIVWRSELGFNRTILRKIQASNSLADFAFVINAIDLVHNEVMKYLLSFFRLFTYLKLSAYRVVMLDNLWLLECVRQGGIARLNML